jgi:hypothetical protein
VSFREKNVDSDVQLLNLQMHGDVQRHALARPDVSFLDMGALEVVP